MKSVDGREGTVGTRLDVFILMVCLFVASSPRLFVLEWSKVGVLSAAIVVIVLRPARGLPGLRASGARSVLIAFILLCASSLFWSDAPADSWPAILSTTLAVAIAALSTRRLPVEKILTSVLWSSVAAVTGSVLLALVDPAAALVDGGYQSGALRGLYVHRNQLAFVATIGAISGVVRLMIVRTNRRITLFALAIIFVGLFSTASATGALVTVLSVSLCFLLRLVSNLRARSRGAILLVFVAFSLAFSVLLLTGASQLLAYLGRDDSLTGRTDIWSVVAGYLRSSPWIGYSWGGIWGDISAHQAIISRDIGFRLYHSHNGFLDVALQVGWVGATLLALVCLCLLLTALRRFGDSRYDTSSAVWVIVIVFGLLVYSVSESVFSQAYTFMLIGSSVFLLEKREGTPFGVEVEEIVLGKD